MEGSFVVTASGMKLPMTCCWTARAETDVGAFVVTAGGHPIARSTRETRQAVGVFSIALGALVVLLPAVLIWMCRVIIPSCRITALPFPVIPGVIVIIVGGYLFWKHE